MPTSLPGPSSYYRISNCIVSEALPHLQNTSPFAMRGTLIHSYLADCLAIGVEKALDKVHPDHRAAMAAMDLTTLPAFDPRAYAPEFTFGWNIKTMKVREIGRNLTRDEARAEGTEDEVVATADVLGLTADAVVVIDYKSGHGFVEPAEVNWQLKSYALLAARKFGRDRARYAVLRVRENGRPWYDWGELNREDLQLHEDDLLDLFHRRQDVLEQRDRLLKKRRPQKGTVWWLDGLPTPHENVTWCKYCPARWCCPAKVAGFQQLLQTPIDRPIEREHALEVYDQMALVEQTMKSWKSALKEMVRHEPIPAAKPLHVLGLQKVVKDAIIPTRARPALQEYIDNPTVFKALMGAAAKTVEVIGWKELRSALNAFYVPLLDPADRSINAIEKAVREFLRQRGALNSREEEHLKIFKPGVPEEVADPELVEGAGDDVPREEAA